MEKYLFLYFDDVEHFVQTDENEGLTVKKAQLMIKTLNNKKQAF